MKKFDGTGEGLKILIYGQPGCGKTWLASSVVKDERFGRALMLESYGNPKSLDNADWDEKPDILSIEALEDYNDPYAWLSEGQDPKAKFAQEFGLKPPYKTIIIDGATEVQRFVMWKVTGNKNVKPGNLTTAMTRQNFGQLLGTMLNWAKYYLELNKLGFHIILTGLEMNKQDESQLIRNMPLFWGQSGNEICGYAYMVIRLSTRLAVDPDLKAEDKAVLSRDVFNIAQFVETKRTYAKDQYNTGLTHLIDPTMAKVADLIGLSS